MKKIAVITQGVSLGKEPGYTRFKYIAQLLSEKGFKVDLITSSFQHWEKKQRNLKEINLNEYNFSIKFFKIGRASCRERVFRSV